jgi:hypothetical protein
MEVCQEQPLDVLPTHLELREALHRASAGVEQKCLPSSLDQNTGPESVHGWHRRPRAKKTDSNHGLTMPAIFCQPSIVRNLNVQRAIVPVVRQGFAKERNRP